MDLWAIIPVKPFRNGKSRLSSLLGAEERAALNRHLFGRVLDATLSAFRSDRIVVATADPLLLALMRGQGLHAVDDDGSGLNPALAQATRYAMERGAHGTVMLPSDLPHASPADIAALKSALGDAPGCVVAPDEEEQGTNALALVPPDPGFYRFGEGSFQAHLAEARTRKLPVRILRRPGLAHDLDTPDNYRRFAKEQRTMSGAMA